ncbi:MAG: hypothetical protein GF313_00495 [Caldithrix sp.]|nr:hypothetical protein [Caldithrix sp.]
MSLDVQGQINTDQSLPYVVYFDDEKIGSLTSLAYHPLKRRYIGIGYIRKMYTAAPEDMQVYIDTGTDRVPATIKIPLNIKQ